MWVIGYSKIVNHTQNFVENPSRIPFTKVILLCKFFLFLKTYSRLKISSCIKDFFNVHLFSGLGFSFVCLFLKFHLPLGVLPLVFRK